MGQLDYSIKNEELPKSEFPVMEPGTYVCEVERVEDKKTKKGDEMTSILLRVKEGEYENFVVWANILMQPTKKFGRQRAKQFLHSPGLNTNAKRSYTTGNWVGKRCIVKVGIEESEEFGNRNVAKWFEPLDGNEKAPDEQLRPVGPEARCQARQQLAQTVQAHGQ